MNAQESGNDLSFRADRTPRRQLVTDLLLLAIIGLIIQGFWSWRVQEPTYMDAYYYTTNGYQLSQGKGFTESIIWQFLDNPTGLPSPSHSYWMPLPSIIAAAGYMIWDDFRGAQLLFWLLGGLLPLLSYAIVMILAGERWQAWAAALFTAAGGFYSAFLGQPTTFAPFAWAGASSLLFIGLAISIVGRHENSLLVTDHRGSRRLKIYLFAAGITAGAAHLSRADGLLILAIAIILWIVSFSKSSGALKTTHVDSGSESKKELPEVGTSGALLVGILLLLAGYLVAMGPWLVRNWLEFGSPLSHGGIQGLFLTSYDDIFAYDRVINAKSYFDWGLKNILESKLLGLSVGLQTYFAVVGFIFLTPFVIIGSIKNLRCPQQRSYLLPVVTYELSLFLLMTLVFTFPGIRGSLFHSSIALWPWATVLAAFGIGTTIDWIARRLTHWQPEKAKLRFSALFVIIAFFVGFSISWPRTISEENGKRLSEIGSALPDDSVVIVGNAPAFYYYTGLSAISIPNEPVEGVLAVAQQFGGSFLLLDENHPQPLVDLYHGKESYPDIQLLEIYDRTKLFQITDSKSGSN